MEPGVNSHSVTAAAAQAEPIDAREHQKQLNDLNAKHEAELAALRRKLAAAHTALQGVVTSLQAAADVGALSAPALLGNLRVASGLIAEMARGGP